MATFRQVRDEMRQQLIPLLQGETAIGEGMQVHSELTHACQDPDCRGQESAEPLGDRRSPPAKLEQGRFYNSPVIGHLLEVL